MNDSTNDINEYDDSEEVSLASPWRRIGAWLLDTVFYFLTLVPVCVAIVFSYDSTQEIYDISIVILFGILSSILLLILLIWNVVRLSKHGQTLGKRVVGVKIIRTNGEEAGFLRAVLLRGFSFIYGFLIGILNTVTSNIGSLLLVISVIMLFAHSERRTLWDLLADTVVIQLPKEK